MRRYTVVLLTDPESGGYVVQVPALPECVTEGETVEEALDMARDVIRLVLESRAARGESLPVEQAGLIVQVASVDVDCSDLASAPSAPAMEATAR